MANLTKPPFGVPVVNKDTGLITAPWSGWVLKLFSRVGSDNGGLAPIDAKYIVQTSDDNLTAEQALNTLDSGFLKVTTVTGVVSSTGHTLIEGSDLSTTGVMAGTYSVNGSDVFTVDDNGRLTAAFSPTISAIPGGAAGGDLSGTYPNPTVTNINTATLGATTATSGNILIGDGSQWATQAVSGDATLSSSGALTLSNSGISAASYGLHIATFDVKGRATSATTRTLTAPAAGFTISNGDGISGNPTFALANDLAALEAMSSTGLVARTGSETYSQRTITGTSNRLDVTNGNGVSGNPTLDISSSYVGQTSITTLGTISTGTVPFANTSGVANSGANSNITSMTGLSTTLKAPTAILDSNSNEVVKFTGTASAVNEVTLSNATTLNVPAVSATGDDTNIGIAIQAKATGQVLLSSTNTSTPVGIYSGTTYQHLTNFAFSNTANTRTVTFPDADFTVCKDVGSSNIVTVGTITSGTWNGTDIAYANIAQGSALSVLGVTGNATADVASIVAGSDKQVLRRSGTSVAFGAIDISSSSAVSGNLSSANGGADTWTTWTPGYTGFSANPTATARYRQVGKGIELQYQTTAYGTSNATTFTITGLPVNPGASTSSYYFPCLVNNGATGLVTGLAVLLPSSGTITMYATPALGTWLNTGNKGAYFTIAYEID